MWEGRTAGALTLAWLMCAGLWNLVGTTGESLLTTLLSLFWCSPVLTLPAALAFAWWSERRGLTWFRANRWNYAGFLTAVALTVAVTFGLIATVVSAVSGGGEAAMWVLAIVFLASFFTALPVWFMAAGLIIGPGPAPRPAPTEPSPAPR